MCEKGKMAPEELEKVTGGSVFDPIPDDYKKVTVKDESEGRPLCPFCEKQVMDFQMETPEYGYWAFICPKCKRYFIKTWGGEWYERP